MIINSEGVNFCHEIFDSTQNVFDKWKIFWRKGEDHSVVVTKDTLLEMRDSVLKKVITIELERERMIDYNASLLYKGYWYVLFKLIKTQIKMR